MYTFSDYSSEPVYLLLGQWIAKFNQILLLCNPHPPNANHRGPCHSYQQCLVQISLFKSQCKKKVSSSILPDYWILHTHKRREWKKKKKWRFQSFPTLKTKIISHRKSSSTDTHVFGFQDFVYIPILCTRRHPLYHILWEREKKNGKSKHFNFPHKHTLKLQYQGGKSIVLATNSPANWGRGGVCVSVQ